MSPEKQRILNMVAEKKITVEEAEKLLNALSYSNAKNDSVSSAPKKPKFLRVQVEPKNQNGDRERVNIKVPFQLLRSGMKLASLVPNRVHGTVNSALKEKGIDFDMSKVKDGNLEELVDHLGEMTVDVDSDNEKVKIFCE